MSKLLGKIAMVTGAGRGIGREIALEFAREGADVISLTASGVSGAETARAVQALGRRALSLKADVADYVEVRSMLARAYEAFNRIDILVNAAGVDRPASMVDVAADSWRQVIDVNLNGTFYCCQAVGKYMIEGTRGGCIINIASMSAQQPELGHNAYSPSKAAVLSLTELLAIEWAQYGIRVNAISPGVTVTSFEESNYPSREDMLARAKTVPLGTLAAPIDHAKAVVFLASDDARYITACNLRIDGGSACSLFYLVPQRGIRGIAPKAEMVEEYYKLIERRIALGAETDHP